MHFSPKYVVLEKRVGETPKAALDTWREAHPAYASVPAAYAGRLDPMASGKLLVLLGDECKKQAKYHGLDKEYEIEVLLGAGTDTGDTLGMPTLGKEVLVDAKQIKDAVSSQKGTHSVPYPAFSSKTVNGKPLFLHALLGTLGEIEIPVHEERIYGLRVLGIEEISGGVLLQRIQETLSHAPRTNEASKELGADFRQDVIRAEWKELLEAVPERRFSIVRIRVRCGAGTYMRSLAGRIGEGLGTSGCAVSIRRTKIFSASGLGVWRARY